MFRRAVAGLSLVLATAVLWTVASVSRAEQDEDGVPKELQPRLVTLDEKDVPLSVALAELVKQTGNVVEDRRKDKDDPRLKLELRKATFWQALDAIAKEADAKIALYERDGKLALVDGPNVSLPVSYHGLFRVGVKEIHVTRKLEPESHYATVHLEVAWEPRFTPFLLETQPDALEAKDDKGTVLQLGENPGKGQTAIGRRNAVELEVRAPAPRRAAPHYGLLKGKLSIVGPTKMLSFAFDKLGKIEKLAEALKETKDGVTVRLRKFQMEGQAGDEIWTAEVRLEYPADGPSFESFQSWMVNNEMHLEKTSKDGTVQRFPVNGGYETDEVSENQAVIRYRFTDEPEKNLALGKPSDWKLIYRTPGRIYELPVPFEFKDLPLP
jgi:hypothetical protein